LLRFAEAGKILGFPKLYEPPGGTITVARHQTRTMGQCVLGHTMWVGVFNLGLLEYYIEIEKC